MTRIAICEDVKAEQDKLWKALVETRLFFNPIVDFYDNGQSLVERYKQGSKYDFVFLDVDMPLINGIETGKLINSIDKRSIIIFVTGYPQFAIDAFDCNAFNYLLKSSSKEKFNDVISKAVDKYKTYHQIFPINTKEGKIKLNISDIYYIECCQKHLYFHMSNDVFVTKMTLGEAYKFLVPFGFYQIHQGYIVNFDKIISISGCNVLLDNNQKVVISVRKHTDVIKAYSEYLERCM